MNKANSLMSKAVLLLPTNPHILVTEGKRDTIITREGANLILEDHVENHSLVETTRDEPEIVVLLSGNV